MTSTVNNIQPITPSEWSGSPVPAGSEPAPSNEDDLVISIAGDATIDEVCLIFSSSLVCVLSACDFSGLARALC
jgi:hypothetical protein